MRKKLLTLILLVLGSGTWAGLHAQTYMNFQIQQPAAAQAAFSYSIANTTASCTDLSTGSIITWSWDFGDGGTSTLQNPTHVYQQSGTYIICLTVLDVNGCTSTTCDTSTVVGLAQEAPIGLTIQPNPFQGEAELSYTLESPAEVEISVFNVQGQHIATVSRAHEATGLHQVRFGQNLAAGTYLVSVTVDGKVAARQVVKIQ